MEAVKTQQGVAKMAQSASKETQQLSKEEAQLIEILRGKKSDQELAHRLGVSVSAVKGVRSFCKPLPKRITKSVRLRIREDLVKYITKEVRGELVELIEVALQARKDASSWRSDIASEPVELQPQNDDSLDLSKGLDPEVQDCCHDEPEEMDDSHCQDLSAADTSDAVETFECDLLDTSVGDVDRQDSINDEISHDKGEQRPIPDSAVVGTAYAHVLNMKRWGCPMSIEELLGCCRQDPDEVIATRRRPGNVRLEYKDPAGKGHMGEKERRALENVLQSAEKALPPEENPNGKHTDRYLAFEYENARKKYCTWWERYTSDLTPVSTDTRLALRRHRAQQFSSD